MLLLVAKLVEAPSIDSVPVILVSEKSPLHNSEIDAPESIPSLYVCQDERWKLVYHSKIRTEDLILA